MDVISRPGVHALGTKCPVPSPASDSVRVPAVEIKSESPDTMGPSPSYFFSILKE